MIFVIFIQYVIKITSECVLITFEFSSAFTEPKLTVCLARKGHEYNLHTRSEPFV